MRTKSKQNTMKQNEMFETEYRPTIKYGGKEFASVEAAKVNALMSYGVTETDANALLQDAQKVSDILLWKPDGQAPKKAKGSPEITDQQIADKCKETGIPYATAKQRVRNLGWTLGKATTTPVREHKAKTPATQS